MATVWEDEEKKARAHNRHTNIDFIQSTPIHLLVCHGANYGALVGATKVVELCVSKKQKTKKTHVPCTSFTPISSPISRQPLSHYPSREREGATQTLQKLMKDEMGPSLKSRR